MASSVSEDARRKANLRLLGRTDNAIKDIVGGSTHVCLYEFDQQTQQWEKKQVEGSLFLVERNGDPRYRLIILNRNSQDNFELDVKKKFQVQDSEPFLMFRQHQPDGSTLVQGIWFHDAKEREQMGGLLRNAVKSLSAPPPQPAAPAAAGQLDTATAASMLMGSLGISKDAPTTTTASPQGQYQTPPAARVVPQQQPSPGGSSPLVLDKKSLQLALLSLIQDDRFLDLIHAQYLKVAKARSDRSNGGSGS